MQKGATNIKGFTQSLFNKNLFTAIVYAALLILFAKSVNAQSQKTPLTFNNADGQRILVRNNYVEITTKGFEVNWHKTDSVDMECRYRLIPYSCEWSSWSKKNSVAFFNLPEGDYLFLFETKDGNLHEVNVSINLPLWSHVLFRIAVVVFLSFLLFLSIVILFRQRIKKITKNIEEEFKKAFRIKQKTEDNKSGVAAESVKEQSRIRSRKYRKVTVLFADIQGFTKIVEHINPETLIDELDRFFFYFDGVVEKYNIEKIKTIGDAYMCAGGIPIINKTNPVEVVLAALDMQKFMQDSKVLHQEKIGIWELRIGIHTGPVISGAIGRKNVSFDIWGDTVNIASRMESSGTAGKINITGVTYELIKDFFECDYRGKMPIKYKGETDMYFVRRIKPSLSKDEFGIFPNKEFDLKLQHIRLGDLEDFILSKLEDELLDSLHYHNKAHTQDVLTQVEIIARGEKVSYEDLLVLKTAALLHDVGFLLEYNHHEDNSISFAKEILPKYNYEDYQIQQVIELIDVTRVGSKPKNYLEKILKDADLDYLGRADFIPVSERLFHELNAHNGKLHISEWNKMQYDFISQHTYYTATARSLRQVNKERQLHKLKELVTI